MIISHVKKKVNIFILNILKINILKILYKPRKLVETSFFIGWQTY